MDAKDILIKYKDDLNELGIERVGIYSWPGDKLEKIRLYLDMGKKAEKMDIFDYANLCDTLQSLFGQEVDIVTNGMINDKPERGQQIMQRVQILSDKGV